MLNATSGNHMNIQTIVASFPAKSAGRFKLEAVAPLLSDVCSLPDMCSLSHMRSLYTGVTARPSYQRCTGPLPCNPSIISTRYGSLGRDTPMQYWMLGKIKPFATSVGFVSVTFVHLAYGVA